MESHSQQGNMVGRLLGGTKHKSPNINKPAAENMQEWDRLYQHPELVIWLVSCPAGLRSRILSFGSLTRG